MKKQLLLFVGLVLNCAALADSIAIIFDTPGTYKYGAGFNGSPTDPNDSLFIISSSNIVLDLGDGTFGQQVGNTVPGFKLIVINPNLSNVIIRNGKIANLTSNGIYVNDGCSQVTFENLTLDSCTDAGIFCEGITTGTGLSNLTIRDCSFSNVLSTSGSAYGLRVKNCSRLSMENCLFEGTKQLVNLASRGISFENVSAFQITNSKALGQLGVGTAIGFNFDSSSDGLMDNCICYFNIAAAGDSNSLGSGFFFNNCSRLWVANCQGVGNGALAGRGAGFSSTNGSQNIIEKSIAQNNNGFASAVGYMLDGENTSYLDTCMSRANTSSAGSAYGIRLLNNSSNCYIEDNTVVNNSGVQGFGIADDANPSSSLVIGNYALNNGTNYSVTYTTGVTLAIIEGSLTNSAIGLPSGQSGVFDNVSVGNVDGGTGGNALAGFSSLLSANVSSPSLINSNVSVGNLSNAISELLGN
ncbi:MAG: hypothetical protein BWY54_00881 [Candidatus Dependentiae bacterium ADurb.Bin331]|nr:MAG: hypothetical protein BWY54_00881 [Candidatus Dependentiae bacterium ADurb.Bin331]